MYNLIKLLDEPERLERIVILFLKSLVTIYICSTFLGIHISIYGLIHYSIPLHYSIPKFILFITLIVITWYVLWTLIAEGIIGEALIWGVSKIGNDKTIFTVYLDILRVVKRKNNAHISPAKNVIQFNEYIQNYSEEGEKIINASKSKIRQYFIVSIVVYILLLLTSDIHVPQWLIWFGGFMCLNCLLFSAILYKFHRFFKENIDELKKKFDQLAFTQKTINSINMMPFLKQNYESPVVSEENISIKRKEKADNLLPESMVFFPIYYWNTNLTKAILNWGLSKSMEGQYLVKNYGKFYEILLCNIEPDEENIKHILSKHGLVYLYCKDRDEIYKNLEVFLFQIAKEKYKVN